MINFTGGEPTLHPDLLDIVRRVSSVGVSLGINTNGYLLGKDKALASNLKRNGLNRVIIQFDSCNEEVLRKLNRNYLPEKRRAINNAIGAGLRIGLNCMVTKHNLFELGHLLAHGLDLGPAVINIAFASAAPIGRYLIPRSEAAVDREEMVSQLLQMGDRYHFSLDDFSPLPTCIPWGIQAHPDCGIHIIFIRTPHRISPLNSYVDMKKLYSSLSRITNQANVINKYLLPSLFFIRSVRKGQRLDSLKIALGLLFAKRRYSAVNVGLANYDATEFLDERRIGRCAAAFYTSQGPVKGCLFAFLDKHSPGSLKYEEAHGTL
jgi:MoaA/NifB/PqqE/SkfB family radical SAM enzyme